MDCFAELELPRRAALDADAIRERLHERSKIFHPDGGSAPDAAALERANQAAATLQDPGKRLRHFLDLQFNAPSEHSGTIAPRLMDIFADVGAAVQAADGVIVKKRAAKTTLAAALLTGEITTVQQKLMTAGAQIRAALVDCESRLPDIDAGADQESGESLYRELAFLGKWQREVQAKFSDLF